MKTRRINVVVLQDSLGAVPPDLCPSGSSCARLHVGTALAGVCWVVLVQVFGFGG